MVQGGTVPPPCNRKGRTGNPPPKDARASALPDRSSIRLFGWPAAITSRVLVGQKKAVAIAVRNASGRRRWSKLDEWLAGANDGTETEFAPDARSLREPPLTGAMPYG